MTKFTESRTRSRFCPPFSLDEVVNSKTAMLDKVEVELGDWLALGETDQIQAMLSDFTNSYINSSDGEILRLFRQRNIPENISQFKIDFSGAGKGRGGAIRPAPVMAGSFKSARQRPFNVNYSQTSAKPFCFDLSLNPTRYIQAQIPKKRPKLGAPELVGQTTLIMSPEQDWFSDEKCFLPATNLIVGGYEKYRFALSQSWEEHLKHYLSVLENNLSILLSETALENQVTVRRQYYASLKAVEFYWEFDSDSPINLVADLAPRLTSISLEHHTRDYPIGRNETESKGQSKRVSIALQKGVLLRVYAKTTKRVRFEVAFDKNGIESCTRRRTTNADDELFEWLQVLADAAAAHVNSIFALLKATERPFTDLARPHRLIHYICLSSDDPALSGALLDTLVHNGRIALVDGDPMKDAVGWLCRSGVLERLKPKNRVFVVTSRYRAALAHLSHPPKSQ